MMGVFPWCVFLWAFFLECLMMSVFPWHTVTLKFFFQNLFFLQFVPKIIKFSRKGNLYLFLIRCFSTWEFLSRLLWSITFRQSSSCFTDVIFPTDFFRTFNIIGNIMLMVLSYFSFDVKFVAYLICRTRWLHDYVVR